MYRKLKAFALSIGVAFFMISGGASASMLSDAFNGLTDGALGYSNQAGTYESQVRTTTTFGGGGFRFNKKSVQLVSLTPPRISAGCNGIDIHFGGFSFISGEEFNRMVRAIAQNALGYAVSLGLKTLCPQCEAVIQAMRQAAQVARKSAFDSCQIGQNLVNAMAPSLTGQPSGGTTTSGASFCSTTLSEENWSDSFGSAMSALCGTSEEMLDNLRNWAGDDRLKKDEIIDKDGNITWEMLRAYGIVKTYPHLGELLMSALGTTVNGAERADGTVVKSRTISPTINAEQMIDMFMCGGLSIYPEFAADYPITQSYCVGSEENGGHAGAAMSSAELKRMSWISCGGDYEECRNPQLISLDENTADDIVKRVLGNGFMMHVEMTLREAIEAAKADEEIPQNAKELIAASPLPLYRAINLVTVYPATAERLIESNVVMLSYMMSNAFFRHILNETVKNKRPDNFPSQLHKALRTGLVHLGDSVARGEEKYDALLNRQMMFVSVIQQMERVMQDEVWTYSTMGNALFADAIGSGVTGNAQ